MSGYVKLVGNKNPQVWTTEIILERNENDEVTKSVQAGVPVELSADEQKRLEEKGYVFESSSKSEAEKVAEEPVVGQDTRAAGPVFDESTVDQAEASEKSSGSKK